MTRDALDQASTEVPIMNVRQTVYIGVANSKSLDIARTKADPPAANALKGLDFCNRIMPGKSHASS